MARSLVETYTGDGSSSNFKLKGNIIAGIFGKADVRNENGRIYRYGLWENILSRPQFQNKLKTRRVLGELGHPDVVDTTLRDVSHIVTELKLLPNGDVYGEAEILDTPSGRILKTLYEANVGLGISSRGYLPEGSNLIPEGRDLIVPDDYELITFDFVIDPSTPGAFPTVKESVATNLRTMLSESKDKLNKDIVSFIDNLGVMEDVSKQDNSGFNSSMFRPKKKLTESSDGSGTSKVDKKTLSREKEVSLMRNYESYADKLVKITDELKERYLVAEGIISDLLEQRGVGNDILSDISKRYITAEAVIEEFRKYTLKLENALKDVSEELKVSEGVISDLSARYTLSEQVIEEIRGSYTLAEGVIAQLRDNINENKSSKSSVDESMGTLKKKLEVSEGLISEMAASLKEAKATPTKKRTPIPAGYFEGIADTFGVSVVEAKEIFKKCGNNKAAFEYHLSEKKRLVSRPYGEMPYMIKESEDTGLYKKNDVTDKVARLVAKTM